MFVSYRWSSPDHEEWVLSLATSLRQNGVNVILDKWHLSEGQDTLAFMESMVSDPQIKKVLLVCDVGYVERANAREGGVGTEAQIVSAKVYERTDQNKFAAVVVDLDADGRPLLPHYMATRLYFDMSSPDAEAANFERIVRWIFGKPFHAVPPVGERPSFLDRTHSPSARLIVETQRLRQTRGGPPAGTYSAAAAVLSTVAAEAKNLVKPLVHEVNRSEAAYQGIKDTFSILESVYAAFFEIIQSNNNKARDLVHSFFESIIEFWDYSPVGETYTRWDNDSMHFFGHDCLVSFVAACMQERAFDFAAELLSMPFFKPHAQRRTGEAVTYTALRPFLESLDSRNQELRLNRVSLHADLLNEHHDRSLVPFGSFLEADLTLYVRGLIAPKYEWYPISCVYLGDAYGALPTYARATSARFYERVQPLLLGQDATSLRQTVQAATESGTRLLRVGFGRVSLSQLLNTEQLATSG